MRLCKDSTNPPSHGWPGGMNAWSVSCSLAQRPKTAAMNSGPLSARSTWGAPWVRAARADSRGGCNTCYALSSSSRCCLGVSQFSVLRGRSLSSSAMASRSASVRSASPDQALEARRGAGLGSFARSHAQPLGAPQAPERITPHDNALALGPRPGAFIAPASMRGGKIVHPLAHRPMITQRFRPARRAGAAIR